MISGFDVVIIIVLVLGCLVLMLVIVVVVEVMKFGSVVVDFVGEMGGNCELIEFGWIVVKYDVIIVVLLNLLVMMFEYVSEFYSKNIIVLFDLLIKDGRLVLDFDDEVIV